MLHTVNSYLLKRSQHIIIGNLEALTLRGTNFYMTATAGVIPSQRKQSHHAPLQKTKLNNLYDLKSVNNKHILIFLRRPRNSMN
jgi:hypothetical protein